MPSVLRSLLDVVFPPLCAGCGRVLLGGEEELCTACRVDLPRTRFHTYADNPVSRRFDGLLRVEHASAFLYYEGGSVCRELVHRFKYSGDYRLARELGRMAAAEMLDSGIFADVDLLVPVPLHWWRQWRRGYNQSELIARGMADVMQLPVDTRHLRRPRYNSTQTRLDRDERRRNADGVFSISHAQELTGKHVLLVDDVVTTGSTLEACGQALSSAVPNLRISLFALAATTG